MTDKALRLSGRTFDAFRKLIGPLRTVARAKGYALGVHGSVARDIDIIAVPWIAAAVPQAELAEAIRAEAERIMGQAFLDPVERSDAYNRAGCPGAKAHGRRVWSFHLGGGPYIDLSVMPPYAGAEKHETLLVKDFTPQDIIPEPQPKDCKNEVPPIA